MQFFGTAERNRLADGQARQFVPEGQRIPGWDQEPAFDAGIDRRGFRLKDAFQQPELGRAGDDRRQFENGPGGRGKVRGAGKNCISNRFRNLLILAAQHFGDKKRVAPRGLINPFRGPVGFPG